MGKYWGWERGFTKSDGWIHGMSGYFKHKKFKWLSKLMVGNVCPNAYRSRICNLTDIFRADLNSQGPQRKSDFFPANTRNVLHGVLAVISLRGFSKVIWIEEKSRTQVICRCNRYERSKENKGHPLHVALLFIDAVNMIKCSYLFALGNPQDSIDVIYHHNRPWPSYMEGAVYK